MSYSSALPATLPRLLPATLPRFQTIVTSRSSLDVATGHEYEVLSVVGLVDVATSHDTYTLIRRYTDSGVSHDTYTLIRRYTDSGAGRDTYMLIRRYTDSGVSHDTYTLIRRYMDYGGGYDMYFSKLQTIATSRSSLDVATGREHATLLVKALADIATPHEVYALIRRHTDSGVGHSSVTFISPRCVITRAIYGGLRICYKKEGDLLDFETLWYILLTLRRVDEFIQEIAQID